MFFFLRDVIDVKVRQSVHHLWKKSSWLIIMLVKS